MKPLQTYDLCRVMPETRGVVSGKQRAIVILGVSGLVFGILGAAGIATLRQGVLKREQQARTAVAAETLRRDKANGLIVALNHDRDSAQAYSSYFTASADYQDVLDAVCRSFKDEPAELDRVDLLTLDDGKLEVSTVIMGGSRAAAANISQVFYAEMAKLGWAFVKNTPSSIPNGIQTKMIFVHSNTESSNNGK